MDASDRRDVDDRVERVLIVIPGGDARMRSIAELISHQLARDGLTVEIAHANTRGTPSPADYDAVVIGSRVRFGRHARSIVDYIVGHRADLADMPAFCVAAGMTPHARGSITDLVRETGWSPTSRLELVATDGTLDRDQVRSFARRIADEVPLLQHEPAFSAPRKA